MEKKKDNKKLLTILIPVVVIALIAIIAVFFLKDEEGYRMIQVYEVNGEASIERENVGSMDAYENLNLLSGDRLITKIDSYTRLKLDEDKYLLAEEDSIIELVATGDEVNSRTNINLLQGAVTIEVENKLNEDSTFEVTTPNSVMAVRGTAFRVNLGLDEDGNITTNVAVFEGSVATKMKKEDGSFSDEELIPEGKEARIYTVDGQEVISVLDEIDMSNISLEALNFLKEISEGGRELSISIEKIKTAIKEAEQKKTEGSEAEGSEAEGGEAEAKKTFIVTFTYNGVEFGTQKVTEGEKATEPKLMPAPSGRWDFDFSTPIIEDTEIKFVGIIH